jgi:hypothetical protein
VGVEGCSSQNGAEAKFLLENGGIDRKNSEKRISNSDLFHGSITAFDTIAGLFCNKNWGSTASAVWSKLPVAR